MIRSLKVERLNGRFDYDFQFYGDVNLFTGKIGTGKTTLLKLIWFLTSGNLQRVISEIPFDSVSIDTSTFSLSMNYVNPDRVELTLQFVGAKESLETVLVKDVGKYNEAIANAMESSLFFPTFRRIERHFAEKTLGDVLLKFAKEVSVGEHKFITAVSTYDLIELLNDRYTEIREGKGRIDDEYVTLNEQWKMLNQFVSEIFDDYSGIRITEDLILGIGEDMAMDAIPSPNLSSGEKQLLGFLCYNGFFDVKTIFIDEPELSLHPDWQRLLMQLLQYQGTDKQFFVASHSHFIGVKYEDKEFVLK